MDRDVFWLRVSCWTGALADAACLPPMLSARLGAKLFGLEGFEPGVEYRYAMGLGASLMAGWTSLLVWAGLKPRERKGVVLLTAFPVCAGITASGVYAYAKRYVGLRRVLPLWSFQALLITLFVSSWLRAARPVREQGRTGSSRNA